MKLSLVSLAQGPTTEAAQHPRDRLRPSSAELAQGLATLARLLGSRLPIDRVMEVYGDIAPARWRERIPGARASVRSGRSLTGGLDEAGIVLPADLRGLIQAGEASGSLAEGVLAAAALARQREELRTGVANALAYPVFLGVVGVAAVAMLVLLVVPRFASLFGEMGVELPRTTRALLVASTWMRGNVVGLALGSAVVVAAAALALRLTETRRRIDALLLDLPIIGRLVIRELTARVCTTLAAQLSAGIQLPQALRAAQMVVGNTEFRGRLERARAAIIAGSSPAHALGEARAMSAVANSYVRAGESSGTLGPMLREAAGLEEAQLRATLQRIVRLLEPTMVLALGGAIALVATALLQAMYSVRVGAAP